ncbi:MAG: c-type cytochrome [Chloroflexi bacterium]|nr:c-type cytochrome [Chloroflexota bacterium]
MKKDTYKMGKSEPFFPDFLFKEALAALLVFLTVLFIVAFTHVPLEPVADPTDSSYIPRPEWYFLFLFQMLKYFPGELEPVGAVVIPTIGILLMLFLPFYDRRRERRPSRRPLAAVGAAFSSVFVLYLTFLAIQATPPATTLAVQPTRKLTVAETAGRKLYQEQGCGGCHVAGGSGPVPDLSRIGSARDAEFLKKYIKNPKEINPGSAMPAYGSLSEDQVSQLAQYLEGQK